MSMTGSRARRCRASRFALPIAALVLAWPGTRVAAQDVEVREEAATACEDAATLLREDDLDGALAEANWCLESLQQIRQDRTLAIFPDSIDGWRGGTLDRQGAMGMIVLSRTYEGDGTSIDVTLTSGAAGTGLAALAQMGAVMGGGGGRKLRVQKRTVIDMGGEGAGGTVNYLVQLRSGGMLTVESGDADADAVMDFLRAFPIVAIDEALERG